MNFVAIDFETANSMRSSACSVALVMVENGQIANSFYSLIRPPVLRFDYWNTRIHGITAQDVADKPTFAELWPEIRPYLDHKIVIAHNAVFDVSVMRSMLTEYQLSAPVFKHLCTVKLAKRVWPGVENYKLPTLARKFDIHFEHHHALHDAKVCVMLALLAQNEVQAESFAQLTEKLGMQAQDFKLA